jgi:hypothetical protein
MTRNEIIERIKILLDNLENVCTNKVKAEAILIELETVLPQLINQEK